MNRRKRAELILKYRNSKSFFDSMYGHEVGPNNPALEIETEKCYESKSGVGIYYIWGWPGPDYNLYLWEDYGKTWAFTKEELEY